MARFETSGIEDIMKDMKRLGETTGPVADEMLMAGAEEVKTSWKFAAAYHGLKHTGDMIESIGFPNKPRTAGDVRAIDIYPQGKDRKGVRNAEKAFINHYGTSRITGTHFVDMADEESGPRVQATFEKIWDEHLKGQVE